MTKVRKRNAVVVSSKYLLLSAGFLTTLAAFALIAFGFAYLSVGANKDYVEKYLSEQIERPVKIESVNTQLKGLRADVIAQGVRIRRGDDTQSLLRLRRLQITIDPWDLLIRRFQIYRIVVYGLTLEVERHIDGTFRVGDFIAGGPYTPDLAPLFWLLEQRKTELRDAKLVWRDQREPDDPLTLDGIDLRIDRKGDMIEFTGKVIPPAGLSDPVRLSGKINGEFLREGEWYGNIDMSVTQLDLDRLPLSLRELSPWQTSGWMSAEVSTIWRRAGLSRADADIELSGVVIPFEEGNKKVPVDAFTGRVSWQQDPNTWKLSFDEPRLKIDGRTLSASKLVVNRFDQVRTYSAQDIEIAQVVGLADHLPPDLLPWRDVVAKLKPEGRLKTVSVEVEGPFLNARSWRLEGQVEGMAWHPVAPFPGVTGARGSLIVLPDRGRLNIRSHGIEVDYPGMLQKSILFDRLYADTGWRRDGNDWQVEVVDLEMHNRQLHGGRGRISVRLPVDASEPPHVSGTLTFEKLPVAQLKNYLPAEVVSEKAMNWIEKALRGGEFSDGTVKIAGPLDKFPFRNGDGTFTAEAKVTDGELAYADRWPGVGKAHGTVTFKNSTFRANISAGEIGGSRIHSGAVTSEDIFDDGRQLQVEARIASPVEDVVEFLTQGPLTKQEGTMKWQAEGSGELALVIDLPLSDIAQGATVSGRYHVQNGALTVADRFSFKQLNGVVQFTDTSVVARGLTAKLFDEDVSIDIETVTAQRPPVWAIHAKGRANMAKVLPLFGWNGDEISGATEWTGSLAVEPGSTRLEIQSDLDGVDIGLPEPMHKTANEKRNSKLIGIFERGRHQYQFDVDPLHGRVEFTREETGFELKRGLIGLGDTGTRAMPQRGINIDVRQPALDADAWFALLKPDRSTQEPDSTASRIPISGVDIDVERLHFLSRRLGPISAKVTSSNGRDWEAVISGDAVSGKASFTTGPGRPRYRLDFDRLFIPEKTVLSPTTGTRVEPSSYPDLEIHADHFKYRDWDLGKLELSAQGYVGRWRIDRLQMSQPGLHIEADGHWAYGPGGSRPQIRASVGSDEIETALAKLSFPPHLAESSAQLELQLGWTGDPQSFGWSKLGGTYIVSADQGRFLSVDPGSGRLLGLFNIDTISRRISLDFSDIFSEGLAFDQIKGQGKIDNGNLYSEGLFVLGPSALIEIEGRTGLAKEDYDLTIIVAPQLAEHISVLSALASPLAGAMMFLAQRLFKKQLAKVVHYRYEISGSWDEPDIVLVRLEPKPPEEINR